MMYASVPRPVTGHIVVPETGALLKLGRRRNGGPPPNRRTYQQRHWLVTRKDQIRSHKMNKIVSFIECNKQAGTADAHSSFFTDSSSPPLKE